MYNNARASLLLYACWLPYYCLYSRILQQRVYIPLIQADREGHVERERASTPSVCERERDRESKQASKQLWRNTFLHSRAISIRLCAFVTFNSVVSLSLSCVVTFFLFFFNLCVCVCARGLRLCHFIQVVTTSKKLSNKKTVRLLSQAK